MKALINTGLSILCVILVLSCVDTGKNKTGSNKEEETTEKIYPVKVQKIEKQTIQKTLDYTANIEAFKEIHYVPASPGRIDKIYLSKDNTIQVRQGEPSENPVPPEPIENALEVATAFIPPYLCNAESVALTLTQHKRYQMRDIARLEDRIKNLEYYTTLSLLEKDTSTLTIKDANGIDRFKSGLFVDNFKTTTFQSYAFKPTRVRLSIHDPYTGEESTTYSKKPRCCWKGKNRKRKNRSLWYWCFK